MNADSVQAQRGGMWAWLLQRFTAVVLVVGLGVHIIATHALGIGELTFENVADRLSSGGFIAVDFALLAAGLFHGLNGLRMVLLDYGFSGSGKSALTVALWLVGLAAFAYGTWALLPWFTG